MYYFMYFIFIVLFFEQHNQLQDKNNLIRR